jgi:HAD superfamily hydrolase (TIGR01509 family)
LNRTRARFISHSMKLPRRPAAVIFDMDGLLFDTEKLYRSALFAVVEEAGHAITDEFFHRMIGSPWKANRVRMIEHFGADFPADILRDAAHDRLRELTAAGPYLKPGVAELLDTLDDLGLPRAIATSSKHGEVERNLAAHGLIQRFDHVVAAGDYAAGKPAPDPFLIAAQKLGVAPEECLALEDSHTGVRSACTAGTMAVMVPDLLHATPEIASLCAHVAADLHEVRLMLLAA